MVSAAQSTGDLASRVFALLAEVPDPEIPAISLVDLGVVREVDPSRRAVIITPTYSGCPASAVIQKSVREALDADGLADVAVVTTLSPPWTTDWISDAGREKLRAYGIAPPPRGAGQAALRNREAATCPRCGSSATREISRFGSTPCKAQWSCDACGEPFDRFKCH